MACSCEAESVRQELVEEVELLQAIYIHELAVEGPLEKPTSLTLSLHPSTGDDDGSVKYVCLNLRLAIPAEYPHVIPEISVQNPRGLSEAHVNSIQENLFELAKEKTGSPMLYDLIEYTKECLTDNNIPSCPCVICLEHFHVEGNFVKTKCYHYFHLLCLQKYVDHFLQENDKVLCPMCRLKIDFVSHALHAEKERSECEEFFVYKPDEKEREAQRERQRILEYQRQRGGVINIEEERNKYLIGIKDVEVGPNGLGNLPVSSSAVKIVTGKDETVDVESEERRKIEEIIGKREGIRRDQEGVNDRAGKSVVSGTNVHKHKKDTVKNEKGIKKEYNPREDFRKEPRKRSAQNTRNPRNENKGKNNIAYQRRSRETAGRRYRDDDEPARNTFGKEETRKKTVSSETRENKFCQGKDLNKEEMATEIVSEFQERRKIEEDGNKVYRTIHKNDMGSKDPQNREPLKTSSDSTRERPGNEYPQKSDPKFPPKNFRKRSARKPGERAVKNHPPRSCTSSTEKINETKNGLDNRRYSKNKDERKNQEVSKQFAPKTSTTHTFERKQKVEDVNDQKLSRSFSNQGVDNCAVSKTRECQPPPGFEGIEPNVKYPQTGKNK